MPKTVLSTVAPTAQDVRARAADQGQEVKPGRLPFALVEAFNKKHKANPYVATMKQPAKLIVIKGVKADARGVNRLTEYRVTLDALRAWGQAAGFDVADKGRVPQEVYRAYAIREANADRKLPKGF
jgi:hypothetical protein